MTELALYTSAHRTAARELLDAPAARATARLTAVVVYSLSGATLLLLTAFIRSI